jgi:hypothetical protein
LNGLIISAAVVFLVGCTAEPSPVRPSSPTQAAPSPARTGCGSPVETGPLPEWARAGFSGDSAMPHVTGDRGDIVAAIFGYPLAVSRPQGPTNKILWVSKISTSPGDLVIEAKLDGSDVSASRRVAGGPGPSIIDLPQAGCWRMTLTWSGHTDVMELTNH